MKRRTFLQRIGFILAVLGITEAEWFSLGNQYYQALAQPTPRKLALLVGINKYPQNLALGGCLTDVELQKELLIHRFGFKESDILTLTDEQATREKIESAFLEHLVKNASADDVVVFHFSGYGSRVKLPTSEEFTNSLIPFDGTYISKYEQNVNCLLEETLMLLWRSLDTERKIAILDTSYYAQKVVSPIGSRIRAYQMPLEAQLSTAEVDFGKQLENKAKGTPPLTLSATSNSSELAGEILFSGFSAGLFTYALTQYLWDSPATTILHTLSRVGSSIRQLDGKQQPGLLSSSKNQSTLKDNFLTQSLVGAEGVIRAIEEDGKTGLVWLGGIAPQVLEYYGVNSRFQVVSDTESPVQIVMRSRTGLTAKAQIFGFENKAELTPLLKIGQLVQEALRVLRRNIHLTVALDSKLERIERVDATSGFSTISHVSSVVAQEQPADYVFGKLPDVVASPSRYGLFSLTGELIDNTAGEEGEAAKVAVQRLGKRIQTLLAAKLWRLTENENSSRLQVKASLETIGGMMNRVVMQRETQRNITLESSQKLISSETGHISTVAIGSKIQYRVQNLSDRPIYLMLLGLNSSRTAIAFYPPATTSESNLEESKPQLIEIAIDPGESLTIPQSGTSAEWVIPGSADECEHQLIFSTAPFTQTLVAIQAAKYSTADQQPISALSKPLEVSQALMQDLHNASAANNDTISSATDYYALDVNNWASFSFIFQVV